MLQIRQVGSRIGVEVSGVDVRNLASAEFAAIYGAWLEHNVLVVKDQDLTIEQFLAYSRRFGIVSPHPSKSTRHPALPEITVLGVDKFRADGTLDAAIYRRGAEGWHTDGAYDEIPFKATQLFALAIPDRGGDTLFASGYAAFDAMPHRLRQRLDGVLGAFIYGGRRKNDALLNPEDRERPPVFHRLLRRHSETGRTSLYFDPGKIMFVQGAEPRESDELILELTDLMIQPGAEYRHKWSVGDVVIWDNRCSYHRAAGDYPPDQDRIHWRTSIKEAA